MYIFKNETSREVPVSLPDNLQYYMLINFNYDNQTSVTIESGTKTVYAYYLSEGGIKGDLWLFNLAPANNPQWNAPDGLPFMNKGEYINQKLHDEVTANFDINNFIVNWEKQPDLIAPAALIYYNTILIGKIGEGDKPGYSTLVVKDGPLAKCYFPSIAWDGYEDPNLLLKFMEQILERIRMVADTLMSVLGLAMFIYFFYRMILVPDNNSNRCIQERNEAYEGIVSDIVTDSINLSRKFIILKNGKVILPIQVYGLWNRVEVGDSIVKVKGKILYKFYRYPSYIRMDSLNAESECDWSFFEIKLKQGTSTRLS